MGCRKEWKSSWSCVLKKIGFCRRAAEPAAYCLAVYTFDEARVGDPHISMHRSTACIMLQGLAGTTQVDSLWRGTP